MARNETRTGSATRGGSRPPTHGTHGAHGRSTDHLGVRRPVANSLTVVGSLLIVLGGWSILRSLGVIPDAVADVVGDLWGAGLILAGAWLFWRGRRAIGAVLAAVGAINLVFSLVPGDLIAPVLLIGVGVVLVLGALGGRRWFGIRTGEQLVEEVRGALSPGRPARSITAVFDDATAAIDAGMAEQGVVECLALFGDLRVSVPRDVAIELRQTAVFGDVRAPEPPAGTAVAVVQVRATAVFGDVRLVRD